MKKAKILISILLILVISTIVIFILVNKQTKVKKEIQRKYFILQDHINGKEGVIDVNRECYYRIKI